jgi:uncharacterized membrane protein YfcA
MIFHSSFEYSYLWLPFIGFTIGLLASMMGSGGGFFFLPVLILFFGVPAHIAVTTSLAATLPICIAGSYGHYRNGNTDIQTALVFIIAGILGSVIGANLTRKVSAGQLKNGFGIYTILIAIPIFINNRKMKTDGTGEKELPHKHSFKSMSKGSVYGLLAGVITGTFGTNGVAPVLAGLFSLHMPVKQIVGTSILIVLVNTISALCAHFMVGEIDLTLVYWLASGAIAGAFAGPKILSGIKIGRAENRIRIWYAVTMIVFGVIIILAK